MVPINIEVCNGYATHFRRPPEPGDGRKPADGACRLTPLPADPAIAAPLPNHVITDNTPEQVLVWRDAAVTASVPYLKRLNAEHQQDVR